MTFEVGQRVKAKEQLIEPATGDHPMLLLADKGQTLVVKAICDPPAFGEWNLSVRDEREAWGPFYVKATDVEPMSAEPKEEA